jgi:hypothetical protein
MRTTSAGKIRQRLSTVGLRRGVGAAVALMAMTTAGTIGAAAPASAATNAVTIRLIPGTTVPYGGSTVIKPHVGVSGQVVVASKQITVRRGTTTLASRVRSKRLHAGTYSVRTIVRFRTYTVSTSYHKVQQRIIGVAAYDMADATCTFTGLTETSATDGVFDAACTSPAFDGSYAVSGDYYDDGTGTWSFYSDDLWDVLTVSATPAVGQEFAATIMPVEDLYKTVTKTVTVRTRNYSRYKSKSRLQTLVIKSGPKPRGCAYYSEFKTVRYDFANPRSYGDSKTRVARILQSAGVRSTYADYGDQIIEFRDYKGCAPGSSISVGFENGYAYAKSYYS